VGLDRRSYPRFAVSCLVDFSVDVLGSQFLLEQFSSTGTVLDISRKGLFAEVDRLVAVGTHGVFVLLDADELVCPHELRGRVRRSCMGNAGWRIAVEFDALAEVRPRIAAAKVGSEVHTP
jgi:hypothetical protein